MEKPAMVVKATQNLGVGVAEGCNWEPLPGTFGKVLRWVDTKAASCAWLVQCAANIAPDAKWEFWAWRGVHYPPFTRPEFDAAWAFDAHSP